MNECETMAAMHWDEILIIHSLPYILAAHNQSRAPEDELGGERSDQGEAKETEKSRLKSSKLTKN